MTVAWLAPWLHAGAAPHGDTALLWLTILGVMALGTYSWLRRRR